jgi:NAD(P)-dependent dehydrogenase (short-subunit alcohol dehydrogenase family)
MVERKLAVVTGANSGVGLETCRELARAGWSVVMVCRDAERGRGALREIESEVPGADLRLELCDLAVQDQVRALAGRVEAWLDEEGRSLDALVNNAGLYRSGLARTSDGFETTMAVNHLGHFLLTLLLADRLRAPGVRIVNVSSEAHRHARAKGRGWEQIFRGVGSRGGVTAYCDSKLANVLFSQELQRRWGPEGTLAVTVHPGVLSTRIWNGHRSVLRVLVNLMKPFMGSPTLGGEAVCRVVTKLPDEEVRDAYFHRLERSAARTPDDGGASATELWTASERAVRIKRP